jgi:hypothetical protein
MDDSLFGLLEVISFSSTKSDRDCHFVWREFAGVYQVGEHHTKGGAICLLAPEQIAHADVWDFEVSG